MDSKTNRRPREYWILHCSKVPSAIQNDHKDTVHYIPCITILKVSLETKIPYLKTSKNAFFTKDMLLTLPTLETPIFSRSSVGFLEVFTTYCCWFNIGAASEDLVLLRKIEENKLRVYDWSNDFDEPVNYALMAISSSSSSSSSDKEVQNCSKQCLKSFKTLQKNFDSEREKHSRARLEIQGYELALEYLESRILGHEKNELDLGWCKIL
ncbi:hypothetical protein Tco_0874389 [Tanacetum coccineum]|uniref:Uncharacterized protein n=1 Tax=Tanacetum coccineum TaxID=301880 RepID=A0ABQ5BM86_9ASTR